MSVGRLLNNRPLSILGVASYSIYLWQQPFLRSSLRLPIAVRLLGIAVCAAASYLLVEKPLLRLRERIERRWRAT